MFTVSTAKLTGIPGLSGWSQIYEFTPSEHSDLVNRGKLYIVVATQHTVDSSQSIGGINTINLGRKLFSRFHDEYFTDSVDTPFNLLKKAAEKISNELVNNWKDVEIIAAVVLNNVIYSVGIGGGTILVYRGGLLAKVLESKSQKVVTASGYIKVGDTFLLATNSFFKKFSLTAIKTSLMAPTPSTGVEGLNPFLHNGEDLGNLGALIIRFDTEEPDKIHKVNSSPITDSVQVVNAGDTFFSRLKPFINKFSVRIPKKPIYVKQNLTEDVSPQSKKATFSIAVILLVLLGVSIGFGIRQKRINDNKNKYLGILQEAISEVDQAISLASVSSERSRQLFMDAEQKIASIDELGVKDSALTSLKQKINESRAAILGEYDTEPEMFLDLTLLSSGFVGDSIAFSGGQIVVMDTSGKRIVGIDVSTKKSKVIAGPGAITAPESLAFYENRVFVLESDGIYQVGPSSQKIIPKSWSGAAIITAFAGNIYVLDKSGNSIYRYQGNGSSFGDKQNWIAAGTNVNFANVSQITIDGSIYALFPNSKILKFSQGSPLNFNVTSVVPQIGNIDAINANPDNEDIYLLDKAGKRVVVTDKKGVYKAQYVNDLIADTRSLIVSEKDGKIILLTGARLYSIDIKHR